MHFRILKMPPSSGFLKLLSAPDSFSAAEPAGELTALLLLVGLRGDPILLREEEGRGDAP